MTPNSLRLIAALVASLVLQLAASVPADAAGDEYINPDRPGIADGSNVVGPGHFQIEAGLQRELRSARQTRTLFVPTLLRLGLDQDWELRVESNVYTWQKTQDQAQGVAHREGASPVSVGVKYHIIDSGGVAQPSLGAILRFFPASGSGDYRTHHATGDLRFAVDWDLATQWSLNPNLGVALYEDGDGHLYTAGLFAATLNYNPSKVLNLFVDAGVQSPETKHGKTAVTYDAGVAYILGHDIQLDFSAGTGAAGDTPPHPFFAAGISKRF